MRPRHSVALATPVLAAAAAFLTATSNAHAEERRVPEDYPTIQAAIDAAFDGDVVSIAEGQYEPIQLRSKAIALVGRGLAAKTIIDGGGSARVVEASGIGQGAAEFRNLTIANGYLAGTSGLTGAGINALGSNLSLSGVTIRNCILNQLSSGFESCIGSGVFVANGTLTIDNCIFEDNSISAQNTGNVDSQILTGGAAFGCKSSALICTDAVFRMNNTACSTTGTSWHNVWAWGGAAYLEGCQATVTRCAFEENSTSATNPSSGVAAALSGGAAIFSWASALEVVDSSFLRNSASASSVTSFSVGYNNALGGAIWHRISNAPLIINASIFVENTCNASLVNRGTSGGGAVYLEAAQAEIESCGFVQNEARVGPKGSVAFGGAVGAANSGVSITASRLCANTSPQAGIRSDATNSTISIPSSTCVSILADCSECAPTCVADLAADGVVDGIDISILLSNWGTDGAGYPGVDLDGDGLVGGADLATLLGAWGACPE